MWIFLGIILFIALIITVILLLPIDIIIKNDQTGELKILYKILFKTFGEEPDPDNPITKALLRSSGLSRFKGDTLKSDVKSSGVAFTAGQLCRLLLDLLKEVVAILKYCTLKRLKLDIVISSEDAAETAIDYGKCCAVIYPICSFVSTAMKVKNQAEQINITSGFTGQKESISCDILISVRVCRAVAAFLRLAWREAERTIRQNEQIKN